MMISRGSEEGDWFDLSFKVLHNSLGIPVKTSLKSWNSFLFKWPWRYYLKLNWPTWGIYERKVHCMSTYGNILCGGGWRESTRSMWKHVLTHIVLSLRSEAERLRKQWEEEEEERLKQISVPAEPKSKRSPAPYFCSHVSVNAKIKNRNTHVFNC